MGNIIQILTKFKLYKYNFSINLFKTFEIIDLLFYHFRAHLVIKLSNYLVYLN